MSSIFARKFIGYASSQQLLAIRLNDGSECVGRVVEVVGNEVKFETSGNLTQTIDFGLISDTSTINNTQYTLFLAKIKQELVRVHLKDSAFHTGYVIDLDEKVLVLDIDNHERILLLQEIELIENVNDLSPHVTVPKTNELNKQDNNSLSGSSKILDEKKVTSQLQNEKTAVYNPQNFPNIAHAVTEVEKLIVSAIWAETVSGELETACPVNVRIDKKAHRIWNKALNYYRDKSWSLAAAQFRKFDYEFPEHNIVSYNCAICYIKTGNNLKALGAYRDVLTYNPPKSMHLSAIGFAIQVGYWRTALDWFRKYIEATQDVTDDSLLILNFQARFGLFQDMIDVILKIGKLNKNIPLLNILQYVAYIAVQSKLSSVEIYHNIEQQFSSGKISNSQLTTVVNQLLKYVSNQPTLEFRVVVQNEEKWNLEQSLEKNKDKLLYLRLQLRQLVGSNNSKGMKDLAKEILDIDPQNSEAREILGYLQPSIIEAPIKQRETEVLNLVTTDKAGLYRTALRLLEQGKVRDAERLFLSLLSIKYNAEKCAKNLATLYLRTNEYSKGLDILQQYVQSANDKEPFYQLRAQIQYKAQDYYGAIQSHRIIHDMQRDNQKRINPMIMMAGIYLGSLNQPDIAKQTLNKILKINPNHIQANNFLERIRLLEENNEQPLDLPKDISNEKEFLNYLSRPVGMAIVGISPFMRSELIERPVTGLDRIKIELNKYTESDANYLINKGFEVFSTKPEQRFPYFISAAKVLSEIGLQSDERFHDNLRRFCAAVGDYYVIYNRDVARTYYVEAFKLEAEMTPQLYTKFGQLLMTFLYPEREIFLQSRLPKQSYELLSDALHEQRPDTLVVNVTRLLVMLSWFNPELINVLTGWILDSTLLIRERLVRGLGLCRGENLEPNINDREILRLINNEQEKVRVIQGDIQARLDMFIKLSKNFQGLYDTHQVILDFEPNFHAIGVDFNDTDKNRLIEIKRIVRLYINYYDEQVFEKQQEIYVYLLNSIQKLDDDIKDFPTYYARCYFQPLIRQWEEIIRTHFEGVESVSQPHLEVAEVVRCSRNDRSMVEAHLLISNSNKFGRSAASGIKIKILPSPNTEYEPVSEFYSVGRKTIRVGEDTTVVIYIITKTITPGVTLYCQLIYTNRDGEEVPSEDIVVPLRLSEEEYKEIENPYAIWANGAAVDDVNMFKGRDQLVEELTNAIQNERQKKMIVIYGQKRAGKSSILLHVGKKITFPAIPIALSLGEISVDLTIEKLFYSLANELNKALVKCPQLQDVKELIRNISPMREQYREDGFGVFVEYVRNLIEIFEEHNFSEILPVLILDEFTYIYSKILEGQIHSDFMRAWKALVERKFFSFLLAGIDEMPDFISSYPNEFGMAELKKVNYLDDKGAKELIEHPIWNVSKDASRFQESAVRQIMNLTANSAYYIQIFNNQLVPYMNEQETGYITEADVIRVLNNNMVKPGRGVLNFNAQFDNLTRYKIGINQSLEVEIEGLILRLIAFITQNQDFASFQSIISRFVMEQHMSVERILQRLVDREVLIRQEGQQSYAIRVGLLKHWLNTNMPYREGST